MKLHQLIISPLLAMAALAAPLAHADFTQGFETDTSGWVAGGGYGTITRVGSGDSGIASAQGSFHAIVTETDGGAGPYTSFGGYSSSFPGAGWTTSLAVYLDTNWAVGSGFDYSVASNKSDGSHLRDFIFHVTQEQDGLYVAASNNTGFAPIMNLDTFANAAQIADSGWYTMEYSFRNQGGALAVDMALVSAGGTTIFSNTLSDPSDLIDSVVGGNRYGWFADVSVGREGLAIDDAQMNVPEPASLALVGVALAGLGIARRRNKA